MRGTDGQLELVKLSVIWHPLTNEGSGNKHGTGLPDTLVVFLCEREDGDRNSPIRVAASLTSRAEPMTPRHERKLLSSSSGGTVGGGRIALPSVDSPPSLLVHCSFPTADWISRDAAAYWQAETFHYP